MCKYGDMSKNKFEDLYKLENIREFKKPDFLPELWLRGV